MKLVSLSVIVPTCGRSRAQHRLLDSLIAQNLSESCEVFWVENLAGDLSARFRRRIEAQPGFHVVTAERKGANVARNFGLEQSSGEIVLFLDDDCELPCVDYFAKVLQAHRDSPSAAAIGGLYLDPPRLGPLSRAYQGIARHWIVSSRDSHGRQLQLLGGCVSYKRRILDAHDLRFNPDIQFGGTETDLHERMGLRGLTIEFNPALNNIHHCRLSLVAFLRKSFLQGLGLTQRVKQRPNLPAQPFTLLGRPTGFWVDVYDLAFRSGRYWSSGQTNYVYPSNREILRKIWQEAPSYFAVKYEWDVHGRYWRYRRLADRLQQIGHNLLWRTRAIYRRARGHAIDCKWQLLNFGNDLIFAWLGYGNHRVFEKFALNPLPPARYFHPEELVRLTTAEFEALDEATLTALERHGRSLLLYIGDSALNSRFLTKFDELQNRLYGVVLTLDEGFDFRRVLPLWKAIRLPVFLESDVDPESVDRIYDHVKNIFYMGQNRDPKMIYSSCVLKPAPHSPPVEKQFRTRVGQRTPRYSFIVPVYNNADYILRVLEHIEAQTLAREDWEVIAVDDGSEACITSILESWQSGRPQINLTALRWSRRLADGHFDKSFRAGRARNLAVGYARGENLVFLDSDILIPPDLLEELDTQLRDYDVVQLTRQMVKRKAVEGLRYNTIEAGDIYRESNYWESFKRAGNWNELKNFWKYTCTYCLAMTRENFERTGGFKHSFNTYGFEDVDIGYRLARLGRKFHLSKTAAYHLYPVPTNHSQHFDPKRRQRSLALSCRRFYFMNLDPEIYRGLYSVLNPPTTWVFAVTRRLGHIRRKVLAPLKWRPWPQNATNDSI